MVPGSRVNHNNGTPSTIEIKVYHFSAVAGVISDETDAVPPAGGEGGSAGCFIDTAAFGSYGEPHVNVLREFRDRILLANYLDKTLVDLYHTYTPPIAEFIGKHYSPRTAVRWSLLPLLGVNWVALQLGHFKVIVFIELFLISISIGAAALSNRRRFRENKV